MVSVQLNRLDEMFSIIDTGALKGIHAHVSFDSSANTLL